MQNVYLHSTDSGKTLRTTQRKPLLTHWLTDDCCCTTRLGRTFATLQTAACAKFNGKNCNMLDTHRSNTPVLAELHWLSAKYRINFKVAVTIFKVLSAHELNNLVDRIQVPPLSVRSSSKYRLCDDTDKLAFVDRAFCHATSGVWNSLPQLVTAERYLNSSLYFTKAAINH